MSNTDQDSILSRLHDAAQHIIASSSDDAFRASIPFVGGIESDTFPDSLFGPAFAYSQYIGKLTPMIRDPALQYKYYITNSKTQQAIPMTLDAFMGTIYANSSYLLIPIHDTLALIQEAKAQPDCAMFIGFIDQGVLVVKVRFAANTQFLLSGRAKQTI